VGIENTKCIDSLLLSVLLFVMNLLDKCICSLPLLFINSFGLIINVSIILKKPLPQDFYAMFLTFIKIATINTSLILWV
jgi:hypothetical protein